MQKESQVNLAVIVIYSHIFQSILYLAVPPDSLLIYFLLAKSQESWVGWKYK